MIDWMGGEGGCMGRNSPVKREEVATRCPSLLHVTSVDVQHLKTFLLWRYPSSVIVTPQSLQHLVE